MANVMRMESRFVGQGRVIGKIYEFAEILVGAGLVAVAVEEDTGVEGSGTRAL